MKKTLSCLVFSFVSLLGLGQGYGPPNIDSNGVVNGITPMEDLITKRMIPYEFIRESDLIWSKRTWRFIDLREKINEPLYFPFDQFSPDGKVWEKNASRWSLWTIVRANILTAKVQVFYPFNPVQQSSVDGDQFKYPVAVQPGKNFFTDSLYAATMVEFQLLGEEEQGARVALQSKIPPFEDSVIIMPNDLQIVQYEPRKVVWITSRDIVQYRLKEDWYFDKERSVLDVRILGIAPVVYKKNASGQIEGMRELFWLYFPQCRFVFNNYYVFNPKNDSQWISFDDLFWKRQFSSTVYKQSNTFDRKIESYRMGVDALMESEKITEEVREFEHDVWHF